MTCLQQFLHSYCNQTVNQTHYCTRESKSKKPVYKYIYITVLLLHLLLLTMTDGSRFKIHISQVELCDVYIVDVPCSWTWSFSCSIWSSLTFPLESGTWTSTFAWIRYMVFVILSLWFLWNCIPTVYYSDTCRTSFQFSNLLNWRTPLLCSWGSFPFIVVLTFDMAV